MKERYNLQRHVFVIHGNQNKAEKKFEFSNCFLQKFSKGETYDSCPYCNKIKFDLQKHVYQMHKEQNEKEKKVAISFKINYCDNCDYSHPDQSEFQRHVKKCNGCTKKHSTFEVCPYCEHSTSDKHNLHKHVYNNHKKQNGVEKKVRITGRIYKCTFCAYSTMDTSGFWVHKKACKNKNS
ncbi:unnamed protein product [Brassicogethes aeneus]|uniref:C2H2-type domain-containing protein n=1 Tax=Brassicogethes aeneus TaxID=1431903 RepID=A0A9P0B5V4_BRAAE|nr:unnamed protein product [Brassicogethes aeneus]